VLLLALLACGRAATLQQVVKGGTFVICPCATLVRWTKTFHGGCEAAPNGRRGRFVKRARGKDP
jgi:hypothetical protein